MGGLSSAHRPVLSALRSSRTQGSRCVLTCQPTPSGSLTGCAALSPPISVPKEGEDMENEPLSWGRSLL